MPRMCLRDMEILATLKFFSLPNRIGELNDEGNPGLVLDKWLSYGIYLIPWFVQMQLL